MLTAIVADREAASRLEQRVDLRNYGISVGDGLWKLRFVYGTGQPGTISAQGEIELTNGARNGNLVLPHVPYIMARNMHECQDIFHVI